LSRCHRLAGDWPQARAWAADALAYATHVGYHHEQGKALIERGRAAWLCGEPSAAEADLQAAIRLLADLGAAFDLARARLLLAALVHDGGQPEAAAAWGQAMQTIVSGGYAFLLEQEREVAFPLLAAGLSHPDPVLANASRRLLRQLLRLPPHAVRFVTLGRFEVSLGCRSIDRHDLRRRRAGDLLALLLLSPGHRLPVVQAAEALWPDKGEKDASTALHHATSALRRILEPDLPDRFPSRYLETNEGWLYLALPPGSEVDFETFEVHCRGARWEAALALYGGDLLPECLYADWTSAPRRRLVLLFQRALLTAATDRLAAGCFQEALDACQQLIELEPWHEQAVSLAMRASLALNDLAGARRLYLALERALREDLGTMPQEELQALYRSLTPPLRQR